MEDHFDDALKRNRLKAKSFQVIDEVFAEVWKQEVALLHQQEQQMESRARVQKERIADLSEMARKASSETVRRAYESQIEAAVNELESLELQGDDYDFDTPFEPLLVRQQGCSKALIKHGISSLHSKSTLCFSSSLKQNWNMNEMRAFEPLTS